MTALIYGHPVGDYPVSCLLCIPRYRRFNGFGVRANHKNGKVFKRLGQHLSQAHGKEAYFRFIASRRFLMETFDSFREAESAAHSGHSSYKRLPRWAMHYRQRPDKAWSATRDRQNVDLLIIQVIDRLSHRSV